MRSPESAFRNRRNAECAPSPPRSDWSHRTLTLFQLGRRLYAFLDGSERWLAAARQQHGEVWLVIDTASPLRHLPWELLADDKGYLTTSVKDPVAPIRWRKAAASADSMRNGPLRLLFMACSPLNVEPVLGYEQEEAAILRACRQVGMDLTVEESGSRLGLREQLDWHGPNYFDAVHITGHARVTDGTPQLHMEDETGRLDPAGSAALCDALADRGPRLAFLSGCSTARTGEQGATESLAEKLLGDVAPVLLGWSLPVGDRTATELAALVYRELSIGTHVFQRSQSQSNIVSLNGSIF